MAAGGGPSSVPEGRPLGRAVRGAGQFPASRLPQAPRVAVTPVPSVEAGGLRFGDARRVASRVRSGQLTPASGPPAESQSRRNTQDKGLSVLVRVARLNVDARV